MKREESRALQGIAVLLMLFHHFFLYTWLFDDVPGFLSHPAVTEHFAWCGRICVGIFSFVSGYGMYHALKKADSWGKAFAGSGRRILRLYLRLWCVLGLMLLLWSTVFGETIVWAELPMNLTAMDPTYNATWWFVREYLWMLLLAPFGRMLLIGDKRQKVVSAAAAILGVGMLLVLPRIPGGSVVVDTVKTYAELVFLILFAEGFFTAYLQERFAKRRGEKKLPAPVRAAAGILLMAAAVTARYFTTKQAADAKQDILIVPVFALAAVLLMRAFAPLEKGCGFFGKHSLYLWLVHGLVWQRTFVFAKHLGHPLLYYLFELLLSLAVALLFWAAERMFVSHFKGKGEGK